MGAETAAVIGLASLMYLVNRAAKDFEDAETQINQAIFTLSMLFAVGLSYAGYGIAKSQSNLTFAKQSYLVALLITLLGFTGMTVLMVKEFRDKSEEDNMKGLGEGEN